MPRLALVGGVGSAMAWFFHPSQPISDKWPHNEKRRLTGVLVTGEVMRLVNHTSDVLPRAHRRCGRSHRLPHHQENFQDYTGASGALSKRGGRPCCSCIYLHPLPNRHAPNTEVEAEEREKGSDEGEEERQGPRREVEVEQRRRAIVLYPERGGSYPVDHNVGRCSWGEEEEVPHLLDKHIRSQL